MKFRYRFKGKVNSQFILRGFLFRVGSKIDFCISESELEFVKRHCEIIEVIDREAKPTIEIPEPILEEPKGGDGNVELHKSSTSRKTKTKVSN
jgi:hypothetical protein